MTEILWGVVEWWSRGSSGVVRACGAGQVQVTGRKPERRPY
ncbi:hypothetical protein SLNWT_2688 [Streptomyces albus]|uniref:Uncharacterized protein n=1 Tax=Streptomyces albus (strain ATCC 21838 / DSM 41398 / FERM P-419 / JCM 4703 / NBRC 107858) TaxID=1081613 RepID=A0A0B5EN79_STRA4|nr:hypothetical protein SLNWT_2688 [Streptomyces albus]AOU77374.1 hypothetical protein SLNHY_2683 [Streptomyces albus]